MLSHTESCPLPAPMEKYLSNPYDIMVWLQNAFETVQKPFPVLNGVTRRTQDICLVIYAADIKESTVLADHLYVGI
jgi:hypothetical protein